LLFFPIIDTCLSCEDFQTCIWNSH